jgi:hypothetical protein
MYLSDYLWLFAILISCIILLKVWYNLHLKCRHKWIVLNETQVNYVPSLDKYYEYKPVKIGTRYALQCEKCGELKFKEHSTKVTKDIPWDER